jgi:hypothetical protein
MKGETGRDFGAKFFIHRVEKISFGRRQKIGQLRSELTDECRVCVCVF